MNTYLGPKGYTIPKSELTPAQIKQIKKDLMIKPHIPNSPVNMFLDNAYPAYRESANKFYVPRYYGETHFGKPAEYKVPEGTPIDITFAADLRDYQKPVVAKFIDYLKASPSAGGLLELPCAWGKTAAALYIIAALKKKTIVLVHKEFLMNQWIERIRQFLPGARIGKIQGAVVDIEDKDIVLGMIQSLAMKEYPDDLFQTFGFAVIDEVHHISSEVFSKTLFKLVPQYMLGLSATMNRKDGTTHVFKMFLGEVVFKGKRDEVYEVAVRSIDYKIGITDDPEYNEVVYDFRGNVQYSTMITKLCAANHRSEFILRVLRDMLEENPAQQIIILAHNKSLLKYLYDAIEHRSIASVGYYIGGMKEKALKESESKRVIIATYSMAAEALDIKTLTTLIMATPKTDIEQSVGRILRERHGKPVVVDIVDSHEVFQRQWAKRKTFYKKQGYSIWRTSSPEYQPDTSQWRQVFRAGVQDGACSSVDKSLIGRCLLPLKKPVHNNLDTSAI